MVKGRTSRRIRNLRKRNYARAQEKGRLPALPGHSAEHAACLAECRIRLHAPPYGARPTTTQALSPPNPNEFEIATLMSYGRATWGTKSRSNPSSGSSRLMVG